MGNQYDPWEELGRRIRLCYLDMMSTQTDFMIWKKAFHALQEAISKLEFDRALEGKRGKIPLGELLRAQQVVDVDIYEWLADLLLEATLQKDLTLKITIFRYLDVHIDWGKDQSVGLRHGIYEALLELDRKEEACVMLQRMAEDYPDDPYIGEQLIRLLSELKHYDEAKRYVVQWLDWMEKDGVEDEELLLAAEQYGSLAGDEGILKRTDAMFAKIRKKERKRYGSCKGNDSGGDTSGISDDTGDGDDGLDKLL